MQFNEKTKNSTVLYDGKILTLTKDEVILKNGKTALREVVHHSGGSTVLCEKDGKILLVKQFRYPYKKELLELPAGKLNKGETPKETAIRELREEAGVVCRDVELLFECYPSPGYTDEVIYIYKATDFTFASQNLDEDEFLSVVWIEKDTLKEMIKNKEIKDGKTLIALLSVLR